MSIASYRRNYRLQQSRWNKTSRTLLEYARVRHELIYAPSVSWHPLLKSSTDETFLPMSRGAPVESQPSKSTEDDGRPSDYKPPEDSEPSDSSNAAGSHVLRLESSDALARAISSTLGAVIWDFDRTAESAARSQDELSAALDRLTRELDQLLDDAPSPFIMQHAAKISGVRKRVSSLNSLLKSIQRRIDNIDRMLSIGLSLEKSTVENAGQSQH